jgi:drug/metabolite transporter (DMT)-like permease
MALLLAYSVLMSVGQIAFKYLARDLGEAASLNSTLLRLPLNIWFWVVGALYFFSTIYWIWLLASIPLSIAYPFVSLALLIVPILSYILFLEPLSWQYWIGLMMIVTGAALVVR